MKSVSFIDSLEDRLINIKSSNELRSIIDSLKIFMSNIEEKNQLFYFKRLYEICNKVYIRPQERYSKWIQTNVAIYTYPESLSQLFAVNFLELNQENNLKEVFNHCLARIWDCSILLKNKGTKTLSIEELEHLLNDCVINKFVRRINSVQQLSIFLIDEERSDKLGLCFGTDKIKIALFAQSKRTGLTNTEAILFILADIVYRYVYEDKGNEFKEAIVSIAVKAFGASKEEIIRKNVRYIFAHSLLFGRKYKEEGIMSKNFLKSIGLILPKTLSDEIIEDSYSVINNYINEI
ncbi:TPA: hypothetical protein N2D99_002148 [Clostridium botulinum]|nr:hypothetical protein [Clostridium botulinum]